MNKRRVEAKADDVEEEMRQLRLWLVRLTSSKGNEE